MSTRNERLNRNFVSLDAMVEQIDFESLSSYPTTVRERSSFAAKIMTPR